MRVHAHGFVECVRVGQGVSCGPQPTPATPQAVLLLSNITHPTDKSMWHPLLLWSPVQQNSAHTKHTHTRCAHAVPPFRRLQSWRMRRLTTRRSWRRRRANGQGASWQRKVRARPRRQMLPPCAQVPPCVKCVFLTFGNDLPVNTCPCWSFEMQSGSARW